ncbi:TPA: LamB/YcsF family protein, partial [Pseudomonas aeruginosa]|nr:LamB/YcsF family protein [Pseudomonas aeruginosa]
QPGAVHHDAETVLAQALLLARGAPLRASDGSALALEAQTLCVHGDNPASLAAVRRIRDALEAA